LPCRARFVWRRQQNKDYREKLKENRLISSVWGREFNNRRHEPESKSVIVRVVSVTYGTKLGELVIYIDIY